MNKPQLQPYRRCFDADQILPRAPRRNSLECGRPLQGQIDIPLNDIGRAQAKAAAARLATQRYDALYSSDLSRTVETAAAAGARLGLDVERTATLRERFFGHFQGLTHSEARARYPADYPGFAARSYS